MNTPTHVEITYTALEYLSAEAKMYWMSEKELLGIASNYPDIFYTDKETERYINTDPAWREFIIPKENNDDEKTIHQLFCENDIDGTYTPLFKYYTDKALEAMGNNDIESASKFAGCISHVIADTAQPAHCVSYKDVAPLCNFEDARVYFHDIESVGKHAEKYDYSAKVLAPDSEIAVWMLVEKMKKLKYDSTGLFIPLLLSFVENDVQSAESYAGKAAGEAAKYVADFLETLYCLYNLDKNDKKTYETDLRDLLPVDCKTDSLFNEVALIDKVPGRTPKESIAINIGNGDTKGIALMANMAPGYQGKRDTYIEYKLPPNCDCAFEAEIGLQRFGENKWKYSRNETGAIFRVYADDNLIFESEPIYEDTKAVKLNLTLSNSARIRIYVTDVREDTFDTKFFFPVIANPKIKFNRNY